MSKILWQPSPQAIEASQMTAFQDYVNQTHGLSLKTDEELYQWSISEIEIFWEDFFKFSKILYSQPYTQIIDHPTQMPGAKWFSGARLNFAENLLRYQDNQVALISVAEGKDTVKLTYTELYDQVAKMAETLRKFGVRKGDRVAGIMTNGAEAIVAMLATASIGAVWSSCSPDFGVTGILDRFSQIEPKVLFAVNGYYYNGKAINLFEKIREVQTALPDLAKLILVSHSEEGAQPSEFEGTTSYQEILSTDTVPPLSFEQVPFDHPLYIMYSSGTTGKPKAIVHSVGGTLIQHLKELKLHCDLRRDDVLFYFTTCGWMMWNWLVSGLAVGATLVLYDGSPFYPNDYSCWQLIETHGITLFGTSAKFIAASSVKELKPDKQCDLTSLRTILSTGSPLNEESFDYIYRDIKSNVQVASISGGTDIISCFALGSPNLPVYRGELQCRGLGMAVVCFDADGNEITNQRGELVCKKPFPSMPIYFWNDPAGARYQDAYFNRFPTMWAHGDYIEINDHGGIKILGRSDTTLNPGGVRIGTAEIYRVVEQIPGVEDSLVVGHSINGDENIVLFLKLDSSTTLSEAFIRQIKTEIRSKCTPRHVPKYILEVPDIPYTISGKKVELAVKQILSGEFKSQNTAALKNPDALDYYKSIKF